MASLHSTQAAKPTCHCRTVQQGRGKIKRSVDLSIVCISILIFSIGQKQETRANLFHLIDGLQA